jgi:hypothetical protein
MAWRLVVQYGLLVPAGTLVGLLACLCCQVHALATTAHMPALMDTIRAGLLYLPACAVAWHLVMHGMAAFCAQVFCLSSPCTFNAVFAAACGVSLHQNY